MYVLGINFSHDRSTALVKDGKVIVAIAEERLDRIKHSAGMLHWTRDKLGPKVLPWNGIAYCLQTVGIGLDDLDLIMVDHAYLPVDLTWLRGLFPIRHPERVQAIPHPSHHMAHACSAYFCSPFEESAVLVVDHIGSLISLYEKESISTFHAKGYVLSLIDRFTTPGRDLEGGSSNPARSYRLITLLLGFSNQGMNLGQRGTRLLQYDEAGKTMGLAPYGRLRKGWEKWVISDGSGNPVYINLIDWLEGQGLVKATFDKRDGVKVPRLREREFSQPITQLHKDLAFKVQEELERALLLLTKRLYEKTSCPNLCMAGGIALNSVSNYKILKQKLFKNIFIQPAATDDGNAIGAALYGYFKVSGGKERHPLSHVYLGRTYSEKEIEQSLRHFSLHSVNRLGRAELLEFVADQLSKGKVVAWFQGGSEFGPRALGNRSILADARKPWMKDHLNTKVKFREPFRPYAPAVLAEYAVHYFDLNHDSPFMLFVAPVKAKYRKKLPSIVHIDGTARLQTVKRDDNPIFYDLIETFFRKTGVPIVLNTSFNIKGYPIVETPADAIWSFINAKIDYLIMDDFIIHRDLYADEDLLRCKPLCPYKIESDCSRPPRFFMYDFQKLEPIIVNVDDKQILGCCNGTASIRDIIQTLKFDRKNVLERFRSFLRSQWVVLIPPDPVSLVP